MKQTRGAHAIIIRKLIQQTESECATDEKNYFNRVRKCANHVAGTLQTWGLLRATQRVEEFNLFHEHVYTNKHPVVIEDNWKQNLHSMIPKKLIIVVTF